MRSSLRRPKAPLPLRATRGSLGEPTGYVDRFPPRSGNAGVPGGRAASAMGGPLTVWPQRSSAPTTN
jgi:hypothetical protein